MEKEFDLREIWQRSEENEAALPGIVPAAEEQAGRSINLVERIRRTARREHYSFLVAAGIGLLLLLGFQQYIWAGALAVFAALMIWKYEVEMRMFRRIKPEQNTLEYLRAIRDLLDKFMENYRKGFLIFMPLVAIGGALLGQYWALGTIDRTFWQQPVMLVYLALGIGLAILFSRLWLKFWVNTLYGKKLKEMKIIIEELEVL
jgi:hypothetical protein